MIVEMRRTKEQLNKGKQDWDWWNKEVVEKLRDYHDEGYRLVCGTIGCQLAMLLCNMFTEGHRGFVK